MQCLGKSTRPELRCAGTAGVLFVTSGALWGRDLSAEGLLLFFLQPSINQPLSCEDVTSAELSTWMLSSVNLLSALLFGWKLNFKYCSVKFHFLSPAAEGIQMNFRLMDSQHVSLFCSVWISFTAS